MIELGKVIVFVFVALLFIYMIRINFLVSNKFGHKKLLSASMIVGLGLISAGTFLDIISNLMNREFTTLISICFTAGSIIFVLYLILWSNRMIKIMNDLNEGANNDSMTGLYNRMGFEKVFKRKIERKKPFYIMVFDLDKTKLINDNFGHLKGDQYIIKTAKIIKDQIGKNGFVGRTGGDEFIALIENINEEEIENIKFFIKNHVSHIFCKQNTQVSIGYSKYKKDGVTFKDLLSCADKRMYEDKRQRKESIFNDQESII